MTKSVDGVVDSLEFMKVSEAKVQADVKEAKRIALAEEDPMVEGRMDEEGPLFILAYLELEINCESEQRG